MRENEGAHHAETLKQLRRRLEAESSDGMALLRNLTSNPICSVYLDESVPCVTVVWKQYATSTQLRFIHENVLYLLQKHRLSRILGDDTALPTIHSEDQRWIVEDWMPRAKAAGFRAGANKSPTSYFGKLAVETVQSVAPSDLQFRSFADMDEARQWLREAVPAP